VDILGDDLAALADEDGAPGGRAEALIAELQSFTDLAHSKGRCVAALQWLPHRKVCSLLLAAGSPGAFGLRVDSRSEADGVPPCSSPLKPCKVNAHGLKCGCMRAALPAEATCLGRRIAPTQVSMHTLNSSRTRNNTLAWCSVSQG
jgi:hypothetical protein